MKIVVLAGGLSSERAVSFASGTAVCRALRRRGHQAILIDMFLGVDALPDDPETLFDAPDGLCSDCQIAAEAPDLEQVRRSRKDQSPSLFGPHVLELCTLSDIVFLGLHGACGEDGRVQATFDLLGIPYTGAGYLSSGIAMDKVAAKRMMDSAGIRTPAWRLLHYQPEEIGHLAQTLPIPCVVKTPNGGSSIGVWLPDDRTALQDALTEALQYSKDVLVEERIIGRDITVGVLGARFLPPVEIISATEHFDYAAKYQDGGAREICPAALTDLEAQTAGEIALRLHHLLGLEVYSRTDFVMDQEGRFWCLEVNSLPGLTSASLIPKEAAAVGMSYDDLVEEIIRLSQSVERGVHLCSQ